MKPVAFRGTTNPEKPSDSASWFQWFLQLRLRFRYVEASASPNPFPTVYTAKSFTEYSTARLTLRPKDGVMKPCSSQSGNAPRPSFVDPVGSRGSLLLGGVTSALVSMAEYPSAQLIPSRTPFTYASASTLSPFEPPWVAPFQKEDRASGMKPSFLQTSMSERMYSSYALG